mmetsp:Transcript_70211/g.166662  ORF Transcript_70211/g.166662 Transcript_70211/m.166662 type:complete len:146 (+) Transcript_70211:130-567(+)
MAPINGLQSEEDLLRETLEAAKEQEEETDVSTPRPKEEDDEEEGEEGTAPKLKVNQNFLGRMISSTMCRRDAKTDKEKSRAEQMISELDEGGGVEELDDLEGLFEQIKEHGEEALDHAVRLRRRQGAALVKKIAEMYGLRVRILQ